MGINDLLPHLPGGKSSQARFSFYECGLRDQSVVPIDAAGPLWQCAYRNADDYLRGNYLPALSDFSKLLNNIRSLCQWRIIVYMDGRTNPDKRFEDARRAARAESAEDDPSSQRGQIRNTPEYISRAAAVCEFMKIEHHIAAYEADAQVVKHALLSGVIPVSGDSDLLAFGSSLDPNLRKLMVVKSWHSESYRIIDLTVPSTNGELPLYDLFCRHGRIVFQLYAAISGCDFTECASGFPSVGFANFIRLMNLLDTAPSAASFAKVLWREYEEQAKSIQLDTEQDVIDYLQRIIDIYTMSKIYDGNCNIVHLDGTVDDECLPAFKLHRQGIYNSKTAEPFSDDLATSIRDMDCSQLLHCTAADASTIRGVNLPDGKSVQECTVAELRDMIAARGGSISGISKQELINITSANLFLESQVSRRYIDRHLDTAGSCYVSVNTSGTIPIKTILVNLNLAFGRIAGAVEEKSLLSDTLQYFNEGLFDDKYDNIARTAPELKEGLIYKTFGNIGSSRHQKNTGDALIRCFNAEEATYHAMAFVPNTNKCIILAKNIASMATDEKTRGKGDDGGCKRSEYLVILELQFEPTTHMEDTHDLGVFTRVLRTFCGGGCVAGKGLCRHKAERLWFQYHHWTEERLGIERPSTIDSCSWAPGKIALVSDVRAKIFEQQTVKREKTLEAQEAKNKRNAKRNCTEGISGEYQVYLREAKRGPHPQRFTKERCSKLFDLIRKHGETSDADVGRPCRGEVRWFGANDEGLRDVRGDIHLWGMNCEIELHDKLSKMEEHKDKTPTEISEMVLAERMDLKMRKELYTRVHKKEYDGDE